MKFEEVLPLMKQGRTALVDGKHYRLFDGRLCVKTPKEWSEVYGAISLCSENWEIEKKKVKKWFWILGRVNDPCFRSMTLLTEEEAERKRVESGYGWKHPIPQTEIEVDED